MTRHLIAALMAAGALALAGCSSDDNATQKHSEPAEEQEGTHAEVGDHESAQDHEASLAHSPKFGGVLVEVGDHFANLEVLLLEADRTATIYTLDAHAEYTSRVTNTSLSVEIALEGGLVVVEFPAVENPLTGETVGDTSQFTTVLTDEQFRAVADGKATLKTVTIKGGTFTDLALGPVATVR